MLLPRIWIRRRFALLPSALSGERLAPCLLGSVIPVQRGCYLGGDVRVRTGCGPPSAATTQSPELGDAYPFLFLILRLRPLGVALGHWGAMVRILPR